MNFEPKIVKLFTAVLKRKLGDLFVDCFLSDDHENLLYINLKDTHPDSGLFGEELKNLATTMGYNKKDLIYGKRWAEPVYHIRLKHKNER